MFECEKVIERTKVDKLDKLEPPFPTVPRSAVPGNVWPAVPNPDDALMLALLHQFEQSEWWSASEIQAAQMAQAHQLIRHAQDHSAFHRQRLAAWALAENMSFEGFQTLPILTRTDVRDDIDKIMCRKIPKAHYPLSQIQTTGSTGQPVVVRKTAITRALVKAAYQRSHIWHRRDLHRKTAAINALNSKLKKDTAAGKRSNWSAGYNTGPMVSFDITRTVDEQMAWLEKEKPDYLLTFSSNLLALIRAYPDAAQRLPSLKCITSMGETLLPETREACAEHWAIPLTDIYSTQEVGVIAIQCPNHAHYHIQAESLLVEILGDDNRPVAPGEVGRVVVTDLHNFAMPIIRYDIGDYAEAGGACDCGRGLPVLNQIMGRTRHLFALPDGRTAWPSLGSKLFIRFPEIRQRQLVQQKDLSVDIRLVVSTPLKPIDEETLKTELAEIMGHPLTFNIRYVAEIKRAPGGKFEDFVSLVNA